MHPPTTTTTTTRLVAWNIQQGGASRAPAIFAQLASWRPDICVLTEFCNTDGSKHIRKELHGLGLEHTLSTVQDGDRWQKYGLLVASRWPLTPLDYQLDGMPEARWVGARVEGEEPLLLGAVHVPNRDELGGVKYRCLNALLGLAAAHQDARMVILGDFNTGRAGLDEQSSYFDRREDEFMRGMERAGWPSALRLVHGDGRHYSYWHGKAKTGFLIDHAFVAPPLAARVAGCTLAHAPAGWPSDHAALIAEIGW